MTPSEHLDYREALGAYALGALPDAEAEQLHRHLETCPECRAELASLRPAVDALPASVDPVEPPPELRARLMKIVGEEAALLRAAGEGADQAPSASPSRRRWLAGPRLPLAVGFAVACVAAIVIVLVINATTTRTIPVQITARALRHAHVTLTVRGDHAQLEVAGLPAPAAGHVEELWVQHRGAPPTPAGTFVLQTGSVAVSRPVHSGDLVLMTIEPGSGTARPTTSPLLVARV